jgi:hypothetical protein
MSQLLFDITVNQEFIEMERLEMILILGHLIDLVTTNANYY